MIHCSIQRASVNRESWKTLTPHFFPAAVYSHGTITRLRYEPTAHKERCDCVSCNTRTSHVNMLILEHLDFLQSIQKGITEHSRNSHRVQDSISHLQSPVFLGRCNAISNTFLEINFPWKSLVAYTCQALRDLFEPHSLLHVLNTYMQSDVFNDKLLGIVLPDVLVIWFKTC